MTSPTDILDHRHCPRRYWLQRYQPDPGLEARANQRRMQDAQLAAVLRGLHPGGRRIEGDDIQHILDDTYRALRRKPRPLYQAAFAHRHLLVRADLLLPGLFGYTLIMATTASRIRKAQVKAAAIQAWVIAQADVLLDRIVIAHINDGFRFLNRTDQRVFAGGGEEAFCPGEGVYAGLLAHVDVTRQVRKRLPRVAEWLNAVHTTLAGDEPISAPGRQCNQPDPCPFLSRCQPEISNHPAITPNPVELGEASYPRYYLHIQTTQSLVPTVLGTGPRCHFPFLWSCRIEEADGSQHHTAFLTQDNTFPTREFADTLLETLEPPGPILVEDRDFVHYRLLDLGILMSDLFPRIEALIPRLVGLGQTTDARPVDKLELPETYSARAGFAEYIDPKTPADRCQALRRSLLEQGEREGLRLVELAKGR